MDGPRSFSRLLFALFDEAFEALATISSCGFSSQTYSDCRENGTLSAAVVAYDEIDKRP